MAVMNKYELEKERIKDTEHEIITNKILVRVIDFVSGRKHKFTIHAESMEEAVEAVKHFKTLTDALPGGLSFKFFIECVEPDFL